MTGKRLTVTYNINEFIHKAKMRTSVEFITGIEMKIKRILNESMERAKKNKRTTLMERDI